MKYILPFLFVLVAVPTFAQETPDLPGIKPKPTLAQCRADSDAWARIDPMNDSKSNFNHDDLQDMVFEMGRCVYGVDAKNKEKYVQVSTTLQTCIALRYYDFLSRHPEMWKPFEKEDAAGQR